MNSVTKPTAYQGEQASSLPTENGRTFVVSKAGLDSDGYGRDVLRGEMDAASDGRVGAAP